MLCKAKCCIVPLCVCALECLTVSLLIPFDICLLSVCVVKSKLFCLLPAISSLCQFAAVITVTQWYWVTWLQTRISQSQPDPIRPHFLSIMKETSLIGCCDWCWMRVWAGRGQGTWGHGEVTMNRWDQDVDEIRQSNEGTSESLCSYYLNYTGVEGLLMISVFRFNIPVF